jgi:hypothetical protein
MSTDKEVVAAVKGSLSPARISTYEAAARPKDDADPAALVLYAWNAEVSGALLADLHVCEVVVRNAVSEVLQKVYGPRWPWSPTFEFSLPDPLRGYSPRKDLCSARRTAQTTGKVIPELKMVFWQKLFTGRYDVRLWDPHLLLAFPHLNTTKNVRTLRAGIYKDMDQLRELRNRIAHHEPIFTRKLVDDHAKIFALIGWRCPTTAAWLASHERAGEVIAENPQRPTSDTTFFL